MTIDEFVTEMAENLGIDVDNIAFEFKDDKMVITIKELDEDSFDEDQDLGDSDE